MKLDTLDHPKTNDLCARMDAPLPLALGYLELLWHFTAKHAPQGDIGKWSNASIAKACHYPGDPDQFILELSQSRFIDESDDHRLVVHDWHDHAPAWVSAKLKKLKQNFVTKNPVKTKPSDLEGSKNALSEGLEATTSLTKANQGKPSSGAKSRAQDEIWDAVMEVCGLADRAPTKSERGAWNKAVKELRDINATPADIHARAKAYRKNWPNVSLTPNALAKNWNQCAPSEPTARAGPKTLDTMGEIELASKCRELGINDSGMSVFEMRKAIRNKEAA